MKNNTKKFQILKAAQKRFARHGLFKTSVEEIARDLRIAKATIYHYFTSKEDIFFKVLHSETEKFIAELKEVLEKPDLDTAAKISAYIDIKEQVKEKYSLLYDLIINLQKEHPLEADETVLKNLIQQEIDIVSAFLKKVINKKADPSLSEYLVYQTWGFVLSSRFLELSNIGDSKKIKEHFCKTFEKGVI